jgi:tRNA-specific 2-thiouridylase
MFGKKRVVVAMSGGVDSSVVAAMLKAEGHEVIGVTLQLYDYGKATGKQKACCASKDIQDAFMVCQKIDIPHYTFNYESVFREEVIEKFADSYLAGYTPIPCVECNQTVKFRDLYKIAKELDADFLATGHYVRRIEDADGVKMLQGADKTKDQSYFLFSTTREQLEFLRFPLGGQTKDETRKIASEMGLNIAQKPDSQDICFVPNGDYRSVVEKIRPNSSKNGDLVDIESGKVIGMHGGVLNFTLGQRRGLGISSTNPLFVVKIDAEKNIVYVGDERLLYQKSFKISNPNLLLNPSEKLDKFNISVKLRSAQTPVAAKIDLDKNLVELDKPQKAITPGQACVFYDSERVLGGGWIELVL